MLAAEYGAVDAMLFIETELLFAPGTDGAGIRCDQQQLATWPDDQRRLPTPPSGVLVGVMAGEQVSRGRIAVDDLKPAITNEIGLDVQRSSLQVPP